MHLIGNHAHSTKRSTPAQTSYSSQTHSSSPLETLVMGDVAGRESQAKSTVHLQEAADAAQANTFTAGQIL